MFSDVTLLIFVCHEIQSMESPTNTQADGEWNVDVEKTDVLQVEELDELKPESSPPKSNTLKVGKRTAFVYTGAAILIVVVGLRTLLQMADEGFGMVEYITISALMIEFSVLLLYAFTIYSVSKDDARKENFSVASKDMPAVAIQLQILAESVTAEIHEMQTQNNKILSLYDKDIPSLSGGLADLATDFKAALLHMQEQQNASNAQTRSLLESIPQIIQSSNSVDPNESTRLVSEKILGQLAKNEENSQLVNGKLLDQLARNELVMRENIEQISALSNGIKEVIEEQVTLRIRQEIQHILSAPIVNRNKS